MLLLDMSMVQMRIPVGPDRDAKLNSEIKVTFLVSLMSN
jgi:hypothetical protein